jgi:uncharacterized protein (TIGR00730 family)
VKLSFKQPNGSIDDLIDQLLAMVGEIKRPDLVRQMIIAALKAGQDACSDADLKLMNTTLKEMRFTTKVFGPYRDRRKVTVFGSARTADSEPVYRMARDLGRALAERRFMVITGAGGGIMQAANEGAGSEYSFGVNIQLPFEQLPNQVLIDNPRLINYKYFFNRKVAFLKETDAVALFPGGFGTLDEAMEVLTLLQTGKRYPIPLVLIDVPGGSYWREVREFFDHELLERGYICGDDRALFRRFDDAEQAAEEIVGFYRNYHSMRYVGKSLHLRLKQLPDATQFETLRETFADLLRPGGSMRPAFDLDGEVPMSDEPADTHRLVLDFNQSSFGRLRLLIDQLNALPLP